MRLRSQLLYILMVLIVIASIVEASKGQKGKNRKRRGKKRALITLVDVPGSGGGIPVQPPRPELEPKAGDGKTDVGKSCLSGEGSRGMRVSLAGHESVAASGDAFGDKFREGAVDGESFGWLRQNYESWRERKDLLDHVIAKGVDVTVKFIQRVENARRRVLAALFDKGDKGMIDGVLEQVRYDDNDVYALTIYRPELAVSHEKFFIFLGRMGELESQRLAIIWGVGSLLETGRSDLVVPLVDALGGRAFKDGLLKDEAIQAAFPQGSEKGNQSIVDDYYEHHAITSEEYAWGLNHSWNWGKPNQVFLFLLKQADQGDLEAAEKECAHQDEQFRQVIDKALVTAPPTGSRHLRPLQRAKFVKVMLSSTAMFEKWSDIVVFYLVDEGVWNVEMRGLKSFQLPKKVALPIKTIPPIPAPKKQTKGKAAKSSSEKAVERPLAEKDMVRQRKREEEEGRKKKILDEIQKRRDDERRADEERRRQAMKEWEGAEQGKDDNSTSRPKPHKTPKGQQKKRRPPTGNSRPGKGGCQGKGKTGGKSKASPSFASPKPYQRTFMRNPLPSAESLRWGTLEGCEEAAELLKSFDEAAQKGYEMVAKAQGREAAIERMKHDLEAPRAQTKSDVPSDSSSPASSSGVSPGSTCSTESSSLSSQSSDGGGDFPRQGPLARSAGASRRRVRGVTVHLALLPDFDLDSVVPATQDIPPSDGLLNSALQQSLAEIDDSEQE